MSKIYLPILTTLFGNNSNLYYKFKKYISRKEKFHNKVYKSIGSERQFYTILTVKDGSFIKLAYSFKNCYLTKTYSNGFRQVIW